MNTLSKIPQATIYVIEDDHAVCESLRWLFESVKFTVEVFTEAQAFLNSYNSNHFGCLLVDIRLPGMNGMQLQERLFHLKSRLPIVMITGHGDVNLAVRAMKMGAKDFILKPFNNDLLLDQIQKIITKNKDQHEKYLQFSNCVKLLTQREKEVMESVVSGKSNKKIASDLGITISTVEQHRFHLMKKMKTESLAELVRAHTLFSGV